MYSVNISGYIPEQKLKEFKQHMRLLVGQQNSDVVSFSVMQDMINEDLYLVKVQFIDKESMFLFLKSEEYAMISGSFRTLGLLREKNIIEYTDLED